VSDVCVCGHRREQHDGTAGPLAGMCLWWRALPGHEPETCECTSFRPPCQFCGDPMPDLPGELVCPGCAAEREEAFRA
jgi:hypothetical protein